MGGVGAGVKGGSLSFVSWSEGGRGRKVVGRWRNGGIAREEVDCGSGVATGEIRIQLVLHCGSN